MLRRALPLVLVAACAHRTSPPAAAPTYVCTQVMGVSVTGDWFKAGFEDGRDSARWQVLWRSHAFVELWADPASDLWQLRPESPCSERASSPDRVIFTGVNWDYRTREEWRRSLSAVVDTVTAKYPGVKRIDLLTMLRGPGNASCGDPKTVVAPYIDEAVADVAAAHAGLVFAGPKVETPTCDPFTKGGPHYTEAGKAAVAKLYSAALR